MKTRIVLLAIGFAVFLFVVSGVPTFVNLVTDWYWYQALGFDSVFLTELLSKVWLGAAVAGVAFVFFFVNLRLAQRGLVPNPVVLNVGPKVPAFNVTHVLRRLSLPIALLLGLLMGLSASGSWLTVQRFLHRTPFGVADPIFGRDVGYYIFSLPALSAGIGLFIALAVLTLFMTIPVYLMRGDLIVRGRHITTERSAEMHLAVLIAMVFVGVALNVFFVRIPSLLYSQTGPLFGASYSDLKVELPALYVAAAVAVVGAGLVLWGARVHNLLRYTITGVLAYVAVSIVGVALLPAAVQKLLVLPNELAREAPQLEHHIQATREAWGLADVATRDLTGEATLTLEDIQANRATIDNVRLWDRGPLLQTFGQLQEIRTYYDFVSVDDDRYWIDGAYRQVLLSPRELNSASLPTRTFINERLTFTHGMGLTLSPVNQVTAEGLPVLYIKDLPPSSSVSLSITRPEIYYGELSNDYVFVRTEQPEFDYPSGEGNVFTTYEGTGGVPVRSFLRRLLLSLRFGSKDVFFSQDINADSRVLFHRSIRERAVNALPFLRLDSDPYIMITDDGRLKWIQDAYTSSTLYPYARPIADRTNYMRNSVKIVIDAYDGDVRAYVVNSDDPLIQTYEAIFPGVFLPFEDMPADIRAHIRYPEDLFAVQTELYTTFHMDEPDVFYQTEDEWQIPVVSRREGARDPFRRHIVMRLPGEEQEEFIFMTPFTPRQKDNLAAWMVARSDGDHYGELVVYRFPRQSLVFGPTQVVNRMNQDTEISRQISLWDQRGSEVIRGNLLVIPVRESLIFVQPLYLRAEGGRIPELKRVIVAYQNQVAMEETLAGGLNRLFGDGVMARPAPRSTEVAAVAAVPSTEIATVAELAQQASDHYDRAVAAQRAGDWSRYGEEMRQVGEILRRLQGLTGEISGN